MASEPIGIVVGLRAEARIARKLGWQVAIGGGGAAGAARAAARLREAGVRSLVSFGLAGALDPALRPGDIVAPRAVLLDGARLDCDPALTARLGGATPHLLLAADEVAVSADHKRLLFRHTHAHAIDIETAAVARAAMQAGLAFAVLRAICDPANCSLPPAALAALDARGAIGLGRVLRSLLRHPRQIRDLRELAADATLARRALIGRVAALAAAPGPGA